MTSSSITPMMSQYMKIKAQYSDALLFYRMGDFYELFFEDAEIASAALNITLTKRGRHNNLDIPMCGVPCHSSENYLLNLIRKGHKVAICEQLETPEEAKKRGYKAVVKRDVVRLITPGTITEEGLLNEKENNFLLSWKEEYGFYGVSWADISTGEFFCAKLAKLDFISLINRVLPSEILSSYETEKDLESFSLNENIIFSALPEQYFDELLSQKRLEKYFDIKSISIFGETTSVEICAMGALLSYLEITQLSKLPILAPPKREKSDLYMRIDPASRKSLEITQSLNGTLKGSLLDAINCTLTNGGTRLLQNRLNCPEKNVSNINSRQSLVSFFIDNPNLMSETRTILKNTPDMQRSLSRLSLNRGGPKDLGVIRNCLKSVIACVSILQTADPPHLLKKIISSLTGFDELYLALNSNLVENPPLSTKEGNYIESDSNAKLKEARTLKVETQNLLINLQAKYISSTAVNSLKIKFNNVLGYFVETPSSKSKKMLSEDFSTTFKHRQTTTNTIRFSTPELDKLAETIMTSQERLEFLELEIFNNLVFQVMENSELLTAASNSVSEIDFFTSLSFLSNKLNWTKPTIDNSKLFIIEGGRHPIVEQALKSSGSDTFISNNCNLSKKPNSILLVTGPNMAGKSTFLRQNALITILAQIGSYVPSDFSHIGVVDQIFSRVGSSDDLSKGHSTFMVEMIETASILTNATDSALVIMDEVGRGTATYDGLSIAWSILEYIHEVIKCRTIFATHYHELTQLEKNFPNIKNAKIAIREWKDEVIFLHEVRFGKADKSYGIQVAKLAGLPSNVISRAEVILNKLEENDNNIDITSINENESDKNLDKNRVQKALDIVEFLSSLNTDDITPKEALNILDKLGLEIKSLKFY